MIVKKFRYGKETRYTLLEQFSLKCFKLTQFYLMFPFYTPGNTKVILRRIGKYCVSVNAIMSDIHKLDKHVKNLAAILTIL